MGRAALRRGRQKQNMKRLDSRRLQRLPMPVLWYLSCRSKKGTPHAVEQTSDLYSGNFLIKTAYERVKDVARYDMRKTRLLAHGHGMP